MHEVFFRLFSLSYYTFGIQAIILATAIVAEMCVPLEHHGGDNVVANKTSFNWNITIPQLKRANQILGHSYKILAKEYMSQKVNPVQNFIDTVCKFSVY